MNWLRQKMKPAASGGKAQARVDGLVRRGLAETADASGQSGPKAARPAPEQHDEADTGFNPYDTAGPETLGRHWPQEKPAQNPERSGGAGNPYDTATEYSDRKRSWDDAVIDTSDKR